MFTNQFITVILNQVHYSRKESFISWFYENFLCRGNGVLLLSWLAQRRKLNKLRQQAGKGRRDAYYQLARIFEVG